MSNNLNYAPGGFFRRKFALPLILVCTLASLICIAVAVRLNLTVFGLLATIALLASLIPLLIRNLGTAASSAFFIGTAFLVALLVWGISFFSTAAHVYWWLATVAALGTLGIPMFIENILLRLLENTRVGAVARVTYYEAILHPFTLIVMIVAMLFLFVLCFVPFYTFNEEFKFYRELSSSIALLAGLVIMVFGSAKVIDEEIESRTMLTLMSKPIARWQVILGKYVGVVALIFVVIATLGLMAGICNYLRYFDDMRIDLYLGQQDPKEANRLMAENFKSALAMAPLAALAFLQVITLAAISVAISTRWGLAVNVTIISLLYILANLARFLPDATGIPQPWHSLAVYLSYFLPYLGNYDITQLLVYREFTLNSFGYADKARPGVYSWSAIWQYISIATLYASLYITAAMGLATALFRTRELN